MFSEMIVQLHLFFLIYLLIDHVKLEKLFKLSVSKRLILPECWFHLKDKPSIHF